MSEIKPEIVKSPKVNHNKKKAPAPPIPIQHTKPNNNKAVETTKPEETTTTAVVKQKPEVPTTKPEIKSQEESGYDSDQTLPTNVSKDSFETSSLDSPTSPPKKGTYFYCLQKLAFCLQSGLQ